MYKSFRKEGKIESRNLRSQCSKTFDAIQLNTLGPRDRVVVVNALANSDLRRFLFEKQESKLYCTVVSLFPTINVPLLVLKK